MMRSMSSDPVLVSVELRFVTTEDANQLGERIREAVHMIVGREALEDFRVKDLPLVPPKKPRAVE